MNKLQKYADYLKKIYANYNINHHTSSLFLEIDYYCNGGSFEDYEVYENSPQEKHIKLLNSFRKDIILFVANEEGNVIHIDWCEDWILTPHERALRDIKTEIGDDEDEEEEEGYEVIIEEDVPIIKTQDLERIKQEIGLENE